MNGLLKSTCAFKLFAAVSMAFVTLQASAGTLNVTQAPDTAPGSGNTHAGQFGLVVSNIGAGDLFDVRLVADREHL